MSWGRKSAPHVQREMAGSGRGISKREPAETAPLAGPVLGFEPLSGEQWESVTSFQAER